MLALSACAAGEPIPPTDTAAPTTRAPASTDEALGAGDIAPAEDEEAVGPRCVSDTGEPVEDLVGLMVEDAYARAEEMGLHVREVGVDGECAMVTMDLRDDRVNIEIVDGKVIAAAVY